MKQLIRILVLVITLNIVFAIFPRQISAQQYDANFQVFYDHLSPYGQWIEDYNYGYIWIPTAGPDFTPYLSNGYWVLTDYGWMWASYYDWGWATFHYGRWDYNDYYGWFWVPDNEWGPSWVTWRRSNGYYGWAPMRPGVSISVTFSSYNNVPYDRWIFVRDRDIERHDISRNYIDRRNNINIINNSTVINKTYYDDKRHTTYVAGPGREDVQKIMGRTIEPVAVHERDKPGQSLNNDQLQIYRPQIQKNNSGHKPAPSKLTNYKDVKRISEREAEKQPQNTQLLDSKTGKGQQQPAVNPANKNDTKNNANQPRRLDVPKKENNKDQSSQMRDANPPNDNSSKNNPSKKENRIDRPVQPQIINIPKNNKNNTDQPPKARTINPPKNNKNNTDQPPKARTMNPPKDKSMDRPAKSKTNDDKKEIKKLSWLLGVKIDVCYYE